MNGHCLFLFFKQRFKEDYIAKDLVIFKVSKDVRMDRCYKSNRCLSFPDSSDKLFEVFFF